MVVTVNCPGCRQEYTLDDDFAGQGVRCEKCDTKCVVQVDEETGAGAAVPEEGEENIGEASKADVAIQGAGRSVTAYMTEHDMDETMELAGDGRAYPAMSSIEDSEGKKYEIGKRLDSSAESSLANSEGGYVKGQRLGGGEMAAILDVRDLSARRSVAMKVMLPGKDMSREQVLRFISEAQVTGQLEHPNVVPVYELATDDAGHVYYTRKKVQGTNLADVLEDLRAGKQRALERYPLSKLLTIFLKTCDAVAFANSRGVVHRDLKPENVMIGAYGEVQVMAWGLAKVLDGSRGDSNRTGGKDTEPSASQKVVVCARSDAESGDATHTMEGGMMGTPAFMAPEQAHGEVNKIDPRTDIYALGAILYDILVLRPPVDAKTLQELQTKVVKGDITPPAVLQYSSFVSEGKLERDGNASDARSQKAVSTSSIGCGRRDVEKAAGTFPHCPNGRIPSALSAIAMKALAVDQDERYQTVPELQADIEAFQAGFATQAEEAGLLRQVTLLIGRHKVMFGVGAVLLCVVLAGLVGWGVTLRRVNAELAAATKKTEATLAKLKEEKKESRALRQKASPKFVAEARKFMNKKKWQKASERVETALTLDKTNESAWLLKAKLHLGELEIKEAMKAVNKAGDEGRKLREFMAGFGRWRKSVEEKSRKELREALVWALHGMKEYGVAARLREGKEAGRQILRTRLNAARKNMAGLNPHAEFKAWSLGEDLKVAKVTNLSPLEGLRIERLTVKGFKNDPRGVSTLRPLKGMPLRELRLHYHPFEAEQLKNLKDCPLNELGLKGCPNVKDLAVLKGLELKELNVRGGKVNDLSPLEGMRLKRLNVASTDTSDLTPLKGMPLKHLNIYMTNVSDLSPLRGMPLKRLEANWTKISDLSPLKGMELNLLHVRGAKVKDLAGLGGMPLKDLNIDGTNVSDLSPLEGMAVKTLWASKTNVADLSPLEGMPLKKLNVGETNVVDLSPLEGMPLIVLKVRDTNIDDLNPINDIPLRHFSASSTDIADVSPLKGMPLKILDLCDTDVTDLSPLKGMPLMKLDLRDTDVTDLSALKDMPLKHLGLPPNAQNIDFLRDKDSLKTITIRTGKQDYWREQSADEFWRKYDAGKYHKE